MAAPKYEVIQTTYQNPHATDGLKLNVVVVPNTPDEVIKDNIKCSAERYPEWLQAQEAHDGIAVLVGSGASILDHIDDIRELQKNGATVFSMNGSSKWARGEGISVDYQVIVDAKEETSTLVDPGAERHVFASQCHAKTLEKASKLTLFHMMVPDIEDLFPEERVKQGGYVLLGGGSTVGLTALSVAYSQGFREFHIFGYDSSHKSGQSHGFKQDINKLMPTTEITWAGRKFELSVAMKAQAEKFLIIAKTLKNNGCDLHVYGDGLLQTIYNTKYEDLTEREKYQRMWLFDAYRQVAPGELIADFFAETFKPEGLVIDFGCGTGRGALRLKDHGLDLMLIDFTDNCRDEEALCLPFMQCDLTEKIPAISDYGFCTDVMEHIPPEDVDATVGNIMEAGKNVFFQISTIDDSMGEMIEQPLHLTVKPHSWWKELFISHGYEVKWENEQEAISLFYVFNPDRRESCQ